MINEEMLCGVEEIELTLTPGARAPSKTACADDISSLVEGVVAILSSLRYEIKASKIKKTRKVNVAVTIISDDDEF